MPAQELNDWLRRKSAATVGFLSLRPRAHPRLPNVVLSVSRGQAEAYFFEAADGSEWIVKKFHRGMVLDPSYLSSIGSLLPVGPAFEAGRTRQLLGASDVTCKGFPRVREWFDGTVLMVRVPSRDWASVADSIRDGQHVSREMRLSWVGSLSAAIAALEHARCAHRDLSSGNVYVDEQAGGVALIDWDSMYHPSLPMPPNTTGGTTGYVAPWVWVEEDVSGSATWNEFGDRFALAVCCVEFLGMDKGAPLTGDGGMLEQTDLRARAGPSIDRVMASLRNISLGAAALFAQTLTAASYEECPGPSDWIAVAGGAGRAPIRSAPLLSDIEWSDADFLDHLTRVMPVAPIHAAPALTDLPDPGGALGSIGSGPAQPPPPKAPPLPPDPWRHDGGS